MHHPEAEWLEKGWSLQCAERGGRVCGARGDYPGSLTVSSVSASGRRDLCYNGPVIAETADGT